MFFPPTKLSLQLFTFANAATADAQERRGLPLEKKEEESGGAPRGCSIRPPPPPPSTAAETVPTNEVEPSLPTLGGLKLSLLGSCDASRSPPPAGLLLLPAGRLGDVGAVSPCESARSSASNKGEEHQQSAMSFSDPPLLPPDTGAPRGGMDQPSSSSSASPVYSPLLSASVDKLLQFPRGRSLRFFIDGDEDLGNEKRSEG